MKPRSRHVVIALACLALTQIATTAQTVWTGGGGDPSWSNPGNWLGGAVPANGSVLFTNLGQVVTASNINNVVDASFTTLGGATLVQYSQTNGNHTTLIAAGQTLNINGTLTVGTENDEGANQVQVLGTITGPGAAINLSTGNLQAHQGSGTAGIHRGILDLSGLDTLTANLGRVVVGVANSNAGNQNRPSGALYLAKTNIITATGTAPALDVGDTGSAGNNGTLSALYLGQTNAIFVNNVSTARLKAQTASILFYSGFTANNGNPVAYFRAADGSSRIANWTIADGIGNSGGTTTPSATNDFSGGTVDILVDTMTLGKTSTSTPANRLAFGTLTFSAGTIDVNSITNGWQTVSGNDIGSGNINVNGTATLVVNTVLEMGRMVSSFGTNTGRGILNINGGTARIAQINANFGSTNCNINITNGTLILTNAALDASAGPGLRNFGISNATLTLQAQTLSPSVIVTNLACGGTTNKINVGSIPVVGGYPSVFPLIKYTSYNGLTNIGLNSLPFNLQPYSGYLSNDFANAAVELVVTGGPAPARTIAWNGSPSGDWDVATTANWKMTNGSPTVFNQTDFVTFDDTAGGTTTVNLTTQLVPTTLTVNNTNRTFTFIGPGYLDGAVGLVKQGPGTLLVDNAGANTFTGGIDINAGTVQFGNNDGNANVPATGGIADNGTLAFDQNTDLTVNNVVSGTGAITQNGFGTGILRLGGVNSFSGPVTVTAGTLVPANNGALGATNGATIINPGATLDVGANSTANSVNLGTEPFVVSGAGIGGNGAIVNNGPVQQQNALRVVTLAGNTTFGGSARWDIRGAGATLMTGGNGYNITKIGANQVSLVGVNPIDPALGDINVQSGIFAIQTTTTQIGDPTKTITVAGGATLDLYNLTAAPVNKNIVLNGNGDGITSSLFAENGNSTVIGPMTLNGPCIINVGGTSLTLSNAIAGTGNIYKNGNGGLIIAGTLNSGGMTTNAVGTMAINGLNNTPLLSFNTATLGGSGTNTSSVDVQGLLNPGNTNAPGTFTATAGLILESGAALSFDLGTDNTIAGGVNDLLEVTGDIAVTNIPITINQYQGRLQAGTYRLIDYSENLVGDPLQEFQPPQPATQSRYSFALDTSTAHQVNVIVSGSSANLKWAALAANLSSAWDISSTPNWLNNGTGDVFYNGDAVTFDDSVPGVTNWATIAAGTVVLPFAVTNNSSLVNYTIAGAGKISGAASLLKAGTSTMTLATTNDFTGPVTVLAGTLKLGSSTALGATNSGTTIASGATLDFGGTNLAANSINLGFEQVTVSGPGVGGMGALINSATNSQQNAVRFVTMTGDTTIGGTLPNYWLTGNGRWDIRSQAANTDIAAVTNAVLSTGGQPYNLTKAGSNQVSIVGVLVDPALADINILGGAISFEHSTTMGDPARTLTVTNGATLQIWQTWPSNLLNKVVVLYGDGVSTNIYSASGNNIFVGPITLNSGVANSNCVIGIQGATLTLSNNTIHGTAGLTKVGTGTLVLYDYCSYAGPTLINAGTLALAGPSAGLPAAQLITVGSGATLDVSARPDAAINLGDGQVLAGNGTVLGALNVGTFATVSPGIGGVGALTITNQVVLGGTTLMDLASATNDVLKTSSSIAYGGTLSLSFTNGTLHPGDNFKLFSAGAYNGSFANITPTTPGPGLGWNTSLLNVSGILAVAQTVNTTPTNIVWSLTGNSLELSWPADHIGWYLQVQTNAPTVGLTSNWVTVPGSSTTNRVALTVDPANGSVFSRLVYTNSP
jgi:autotransporter-associated beta strand protein